MNSPDSALNLIVHDTPVASRPGETYWGSDAIALDATDRAVQLAPSLERFLRQEVGSGAELGASIATLQSIIK